MNRELSNYFEDDELAINVWLSKYAQDGDFTPDDMHKRMAKEFAEIENNYKINALSEEEIYELFKDFKYVIPQGSVMAQLGNKSIGSLSNCFFVGSPIDSYGGIMQMDERLVQLMKRRGGVGIDISTLRPKHTPTSNAAKTSTGAVSFMNRFSNTTREVAQNGRRGALMISMEINHPDSLEFIQIKRDLKKITGANISLKIGKSFMEAVENDKDYFLRFPVNAKFNELDAEDATRDLESYEKIYDQLFLIPGNDKVYIKRIKAKKYWDEIVKSARDTAEPGILFWDNVLDYSPDSIYDEYRPSGVNPCVVGDTLVTTDKGKFKVTEVIDRFNEGEDFQILSFNTETEETEFKPLLNAQKTKENAEILKIETEDGDIIKLTPDHKVYTEEDGWIEAAKLTKNHTLLQIK